MDEVACTAEEAMKLMYSDDAAWVYDTMTFCNDDESPRRWMNSNTTSREADRNGIGCQSAGFPFL